MITSKDNDLIKLCQKVKSKKYSKLNNLCFVETYKIVKELYNKALIKHILVREDKFSCFSNLKNVKIDVISNNLCDNLSDTMSNDGVFALCALPKHKEVDYSKCIILDCLQDPSNVGAIIRSARAFGYNTIFAINSVYPFTYKCIRSSMSYIFDINYIETTYDELLELKKNKNITIITADMDGKDINNFQKNYNNFALVIGNEGNGISDKIMQISDKTVSIPMENGVESLNASVSASLLMYLLK